MADSIATLNVGTLVVTRTLTMPDGSVTSAKIGTGANLDADKLEHRHQKTYAQAGGSAVAAERKAVHVVQGSTATINSIKAGVTTAAIGDSTATVDVKKNNTSVLTATVVIDNANMAYTLEAGTISSASLVADDVLEVVVTISAGTGTLPKGLFVNIELDEKGV